MLKCILESPATFYGRFVASPPTIAHEQTPDMVLGSAVHALVLEPEHFDDLFTVRPDGIDGRTADGKKRLAEWRLSAIGKVELTSEMRDHAKDMADAVLAHPIVGELTKDAIKERAIAWEDGGLVQKCKPDWFIPRPELPADLHLDLKTAADPSPEKWLGRWSPIKEYRYDLQVAAHYTAGITALTGRPCSSGLVVVGKSKPHDVYVLDCTGWWELGEWWRQRALATLRRCRETGVWRREEQDQILTTQPTKWDYPGEV
jgi:hypothetical protein